MRPNGRVFSSCPYLIQMNCYYSEGQDVWNRYEQRLPERDDWFPGEYWDNEHDKYKDLEEDNDY